MRTFYFKARNIGQEKYLTYIMGEECELDEDVLDYCEENTPSELLPIIYEEDDDYDYLTYDISGKVSLSEYIKEEIKLEDALGILKNIASSVISVKEQTIPLAYVLMNRDYIYVDTDTKKVSFICLPIESDAAVSAEFKGFIRQLLANMKYDVDEDLNYVGKLLTYINGENFNLRGLIGLSEALLEEAGLEFESESDIDSDGVEVVSSVAPDLSEKEENVSDFMSSAADDEPLPEIGDDEEEEEASVADDEEELDSILPAGMKLSADEEESVEETAKEESEEQPEEQAPEDKKEEIGLKPGSKDDKPKSLEEARSYKVVDGDKKETDVNLLKSRMQQLLGEKPEASKKAPDEPIKSMEELDDYFNNKPPVVKKTQVKVNRAALIQSAAEHESEIEAEETPLPVIEVADSETPSPAQPSTRDDGPKSTSVLSMSLDDVTVAPVTSNVPKANPYLIRVNTEERIMLGKATFKIGKASRGVDYTVGGNGAISRQHAVIIQKDGVCYIRDNKSTNHTYVNEKIVEDGEDEILTHDSMIRLGDEEFIFKIR